MATVRGMGGVVVGGGTLVGSGGAGPQGSEVSWMSSRAMSLLSPPFFRASNTTWVHQTNSTISCGGRGGRCPRPPATVTNRRLLGQVEGNLTVVPVISIVTLLLKHSGGVGGRRLSKLHFKKMDICPIHVIPVNSHMMSCCLFFFPLGIFFIDGLWSWL